MMIFPETNKIVSTCFSISNSIEHILNWDHGMVEQNLHTCLLCSFVLQQFLMTKKMASFGLCLKSSSVWKPLSNSITFRKLYNQAIQIHHCLLSIIGCFYSKLFFFALFLLMDSMKYSDPQREAMLMPHSPRRQKLQLLCRSWESSSHILSIFLRLMGLKIVLQINSFLPSKSAHPKLPCFQSEFWL